MTKLSWFRAAFESDCAEPSPSNIMRPVSWKQHETVIILVSEASLLMIGEKNAGSFRPCFGHSLRTGT